MSDNDLETILIAAIGSGAVLLIALIAAVLLRKRKTHDLQDLLKLPKGTEILDVWSATVESAPGQNIRAAIIAGTRVDGEIIIAITTKGCLVFGSRRKKLPPLILKPSAIDDIEIFKNGAGFVARGKGKVAADIIAIHLKKNDSLYLRIDSIAVGPLRRVCRGTEL